MKLIKCYIENFGILTEKEISFSKGLNCAVSENGTGKTTLTAFIEAMLYGIGDTRKQSLEENPRKKYSPWQGGKFGGSLTVEVGKKRYVIERSFGARPADDTFRLVDADTGNESGDYAENIGAGMNMAPSMSITFFPMMNWTVSLSPSSVFFTGTDPKIMNTTPMVTSIPPMIDIHIIFCI